MEVYLYSPFKIPTFTIIIPSTLHSLRLKYFCGKSPKRKRGGGQLAKPFTLVVTIDKL